MYRSGVDRHQYYIPLIFQFIGGSGALNAGVRLLPFIVATTVFIALQGALLPVYPLYKPWYLFGAICILIGGLMFEQVDTATSDAYLYGFQVLLNFLASQSAFRSVAPSSPTPLSGSFDRCCPMCRMTNSKMLFLEQRGVFSNTSARRRGKRSSTSSCCPSTGRMYQSFVSFLLIANLPLNSFVLCITAGAVSIVASLFLHVSSREFRH